MEPFVELFKQHLLPGSESLLLFGLFIGVILLLLPKPAPKWGRRWLAVLAGLYFLLSLPFISRSLEAALSLGTIRIEEPAQARGVEAIVILGGGSSTYLSPDGEINVLSEPSVLRVLEGIRLYQLLDKPKMVVSGGAAPRYNVLTPESEPMREALLAAGVPSSNILIEPSSQDTREQALNIKQLFQEEGIDNFVLVTSPTHMRRALAAFRAVGMEPTGSVALQHSATGEQPIPIIPDLRSLSDSKLAMRELIAILYYAGRGWLTTE
jgi:uncharacterized SAM-binding protein YcdF (DUF218 family)